FRPCAGQKVRDQFPWGANGVRERSRPDALYDLRENVQEPEFLLPVPPALRACIRIVFQRVRSLRGYGLVHRRREWYPEKTQKACGRALHFGEGLVRRVDVWNRRG